MTFCINWFVVACIGFRIGLHHAQLFVVVTQLRGQLFLAHAEAVEASNDRTTFFVERSEQSREQIQEFRLPRRPNLSCKGEDFLLRLLNGHTALGRFAHEFSYGLVLLPMLLLLID